ncbi:MAG: TonB-dependent receptor [Bacteroidales bacterium]
MQDYPVHERDVAEVVEHDLKSAAVSFDRYFREYDLLSVYASGQFLLRDSYYGANQSVKDYGRSHDQTYNAGVQYKMNLSRASLILGMETTGDFLLDEKLGYPDYENALIENGILVSVPHVENTTVSDQSARTSGVFAQYDVRWNLVKLALGGRYDVYGIRDLAKEGQEGKTGRVFSPRISLMLELTDDLQARVSYSHGYRAPQIFDEDLHIETSGSRQVINVNDPELTQESSHSVMASLDYNGLVGTVLTGLLVEGFYTRLLDPFVNEIGIPDDQGTVLYTRVNAEEGATVKGLNSEFKLRPLRDFSLTSGFTVQSSHYDVPQEFEESRFFRTPGAYGYLVADWDVVPVLCLSATTTYTGSMLVPYFGPETDPERGELRRSTDFLDLGLKVEYTRQLNGIRLQWFGGVKNLFNAYQKDFDLGAERDPAYMYGPVSPRSVYVGLRLASLDQKTGTPGVGPTGKGTSDRKASRTRNRGRGRHSSHQVP